MPTRLVDIARSLNLSTSTVFAAINGRPDISQATRKRVMAKVRELDYRPDLVASGLVNRQTHNIGIVVPDLARSFYAEVLTGIEQQTSEAGYTLLLCNTKENPEMEKRAIRSLLSQKVAGLIIASSQRRGSKFWRDLERQGRPFVLLDRRFPEASFVGCDDRLIGRTATDHLLEQGYIRIAHITGTPNLPPTIGRIEGYKLSLERSRIKVRENFIVAAHFHEEVSAISAMHQLLSLKQKPDAVFCASDPIAIGALQAALEAGCAVPEEIGIIGVGNHRYGQYLRVPLSTVDQKRIEMGNRAATLLLDLIRQKNKVSHRLILIEPELVIRESSCKTLTSLPSPNSLQSRSGIIIESET
jgi:LacI family transcriptional regulator